MKYSICICDGCGKEYARDRFVEEVQDFKIDVRRRENSTDGYCPCGVYEICPDCGERVMQLIGKYKLQYLKETHHDTMGI